MTTPSSSAKKTAEDDKRQGQADEYREVLSSAFAFVEGQKSTHSFATLTPEDCMDRFIERISGKDTPTRPNVLNRIAKIKNEVLATIAQVKSMPDGAFRKQSDATDVNTAADPGEESLYGDAITNTGNGSESA